MNKIKYILILMALLSFYRGESQVSVINIQLMPYNISPDAMLSASLTNAGSTGQVQLISKLYNSAGELLVTVRSSSFQVNPGMNTGFNASRKVSGIEYGAGKQSEYIKTTHGLPSGTFRICIDVIQTSTLEIADQFCDELESNFNQYLYLVSPADKDTVESTTPLLIWTHSEPFSILAQGEYYRMVVSEQKEGQQSEDAITINSPLMIKNYLTSHNLQYPFDAPQLNEGGRYAWQVQKLSNGVITNKTEAWEFTVYKKPEQRDNKYAVLEKHLDAGFYKAGNNKIYFKFNEEYASSDIRCSIYNSKRELVLPTVKNASAVSTLTVKSNGYNRFEIDLNEMNIKSGFHTLEVKNEKGELFLLKFYVQ